MFFSLTETGRPHSSISPSDRSSNPAIIRRVVLLPQPDGPRKEKHSPSRTVRLKSLTAVMVPNFLVVKRLVTCRSTIWSVTFYTPFLSLVIWVTMKLQMMMMQMATAASAEA